MVRVTQGVSTAQVSKGLIIFGTRTHEYTPDTRILDAVRRLTSSAEIDVVVMERPNGNGVWQEVDWDWNPNSDTFASAGLATTDASLAVGLTAMAKGAQ